MTAELFRNWYMRVWFEDVAAATVMPWNPLVAIPAALRTLTFGASNLFLPFRKRPNRDVPVGYVADNTTELFALDLSNVLKFIMTTAITVLDSFRTPMGLKIDEEAIEVWRGKLNDELGEWSQTEYNYMIWTWFDFKWIKDNSELVSEMDSENKYSYSFIDSFIDAMIVVSIVLAAVLLAKNFGKVSTGISGMFGKQMTKRRNKKMKSLANENLDNTEMTVKDGKDIKSMLFNIESILSRGVSPMLSEDIEPDVKIILEQTRQKKLRL